MDFSEAYAFGAIIGSLLTGIAIGAVPAICGAIKRKIGLAIGGFFACLVSALVLGMLLAIPVCVLFVVLIFKKPKSARAPVDVVDTQQYDSAPEQNVNSQPYVVQQQNDDTQQ